MPADPKRVETLFNRAIGLLAADRPAFLAAACGDDADLRDRVDRLLAADDQFGSPSHGPEDATGVFATDARARSTATGTFAPEAPAAAPSTPASQSPLGSIRYFGDYELLAEIARGGMGVVYKARQVSLNREVALKMIKAGELASAADVARFKNEAEAAANLDHPNILPIYEIGEHQGQHYFSMKFVSGGSLTDKIPDLVNQPHKAVSLLVKVCRAVDFSHRRGLLHRDLKPGNILLDADGTPYVADFGLAKKLEGDSKVTQSGAIVGTPSYMAPEQARAEKGVTTSVDVYALGAILYELLTGQPPFRGPTILDSILQVLEKEVADPRTLNPKADRDLSLIALKCLEKEPAKRYDSAASLAVDLECWLSGEPLSVRPLSASEQVLRWMKRNAGAIVGSAGVGLTLGLSTGIVNAVLFMWALEMKYTLPHFSWAYSIPIWLLVSIDALILLTIPCFGAIVHRLSKPLDRATSAATGFLSGLLAGLSAFAFLGPIFVLLEQNVLHLHKDIAEIQAGRRLLTPPPQSPPEKFPLHDYPTEVEFIGAFTGNWYGLLIVVGPFTLYGIYTTVVADYLRHSRPGQVTFWLYLELSVLAMLLLPACVSFVDISINRSILGRPDIGNWKVFLLTAMSFLLVFVLPFLLNVCAWLAVIYRWRWRRVLVYFGCVLLCVLISLAFYLLALVA